MLFFLLTPFTHTSSNLASINPITTLKLLLLNSLLISMMYLCCFFFVSLILSILVAFLFYLFLFLPRLFHSYLSFKHCLHANNVQVGPQEKCLQCGTSVTTGEMLAVWYKRKVTYRTVHSVFPALQIQTLWAPLAPFARHL